MKSALKCAKKAYEEGEVPIGAVVVCDGKIIGRGHNRRTGRQIATAHAEIEAIEKACRKLHSWRLPDCEIYVTLEPCPMCMGAILNARIKKSLLRRVRGEGPFADGCDCGFGRPQPQGGSLRRGDGRGVRGNTFGLFQRNARTHKKI